MNTAIIISAPGKFIKTENEHQQTVLGRGLRTNMNSLKKVNTMHRYNLNQSKDIAVILDEKRKFYRFNGRGMKPNRQSKFRISQRRFAFLLCVFRRCIEEISLQFQMVLIVIGN